MAASNFNIKDFTSGLAVKVLSYLIDTDKHAAAHVIVDSAGAEVIGTKTDAKSTATDGTAVSKVSLLKQISFSIQAAAASLASLAALITSGSLSVFIDPDSVNSNGQKTAADSAPVVLSDYGKTKVVEVTLSLPTNALTAGDVAATTQIVNAALRINDGTGVLQSIVLIDCDDQKAACTLVFLSANSSLGTEESAPDIDDTEALDILGYVDIATGDYKDFGGVAIVTKLNVGMGVKAASGTDDIYVGLINGAGTPTYTASGIKLRLTFMQD